MSSRSSTVTSPAPRLSHCLTEGDETRAWDTQYCQLSSAWLTSCDLGNPLLSGLRRTRYVSSGSGAPLAVQRAALAVGIVFSPSSARQQNSPPSELEVKTND